MKDITIKNTTYNLPMYLPDATLGVVRSLGLYDLNCIDGVVVNTYHLAEKPGLDVLRNFRGVKNFMNYQGLIVSDSGGWQIFSLIHRHKKPGEITDDGVIFKLPGKESTLFSPEDSIKMQFEIESDIIICLDDFTNPDSSKKEIMESVERTILWAKRSKQEYVKQLKKRKLSNKDRPFLLAVIQGHRDKILRKHCAEKLLDIGFDAYGYGGYPMDKKGSFDYELLKYVSSLIPENNIKFALGVGTPWQIAALYEQGWNMFDCTLPTRDARHQRLYTFSAEPKSINQLKDSKFYKYVNIGRSIYKNVNEPISEFCECDTCKNYSKAYLHHLFKINEVTAYRLASIHNIYTYNKVIQLLRTFG